MVETTISNLQPADDGETVACLLGYLDTLCSQRASKPAVKFLNLRDRALIHVLAGSEMESYLVCMLHRQDLDWQQHRLYHPYERTRSYSITRQALIALKEYLDFCVNLDKSKAVASLHVPVFLSYYKNGTNYKPLHHANLRGIIRRRCMNALGKGECLKMSLTPASLREYYLAKKPQEKEC